MCMWSGDLKMDGDGRDTQYTQLREQANNYPFLFWIHFEYNCKNNNQNPYFILKSMFILDSVVVYGHII